MKDWNPDSYLNFANERLQPVIDLVNKINLVKPKRILDIGCGPGTSTIVLKQKWPNAEVIGIDNSVAMIEAAKKKYPMINFSCVDATSDLSYLGMFDLVFSNALLQWLPHQDKQIETYFQQVNKNGILAFQVPCTATMPMYTQLKSLIQTLKWKKYFKALEAVYQVHDIKYYYNSLCTDTNHINIWKSEYVHVMREPYDIVEWHAGAGLRPYLQCLKSEKLIASFLEDYEENLREVYKAGKDGKILFSFPRLFMIAQKE